MMAEVVAGGGELGELIRAKDWSSTPLGPLRRWPQSLRTALSLMLNSQHPMWIGWGTEATFLYNDAYISVLSMAKHPWALGRPFREVWGEIWDVVGPLAEKVFVNGEASFVEDVRLFMSRGDFVEETFYSFSYSPIYDEAGSVAGLFCPSAETTSKVLTARRLGTLSALSSNALVQKSIDAACTSALATLAKNRDDVPFALLFVFDGSMGALELRAHTGIDDIDAEGRVALRTAVAIDDAVRSRLPRVVPLDAVNDRLPRGCAGQLLREAIVLPLTAPGEEDALGVLVLGVNPTRRLDAEHRTFFDLVAAQISAAIQNARATEAEARRLARLAEIDRAKTAFFSNVSHEFRTPLTLLIGPTEDALASPTRSLSGAALESVYRNELRLMKLVNALLDFSRIEAGRAQAVYHATDLAQHTRELASVFDSAAHRVGLKLHIACETLPEPVFVDRDMWEKIVLNLISNALKFTFDGTIAVALRGVTVGGATHAELRVTDTGTGVAPDEVPRLFERFHRIEGARARTHEGSGIGLALVHDLVKLHGGTIVAESELGKGTSFTVRVPFGTAHLPAEHLRVQAPERAASSLRNTFLSEVVRWTPDGEDDVGDDDTSVSTTGDASVRILVADDNADMRAYVRRLLRERWMVESVSDGARALDRLRDTTLPPVHLVLTDVMMPRVDGFGLLRAMRDDERLASIPVIMLSARAGDEASVEGLQAGADDYLVKPFSARELVARVQARLDVSQARREAETANRSKDEFLAMLGHELRNPLSPIVTALELMRMRGRTDRELGVISRQVGHLARLVDDLLDVSRITQGKIELRSECTELAAIVVRALEMTLPMIEQRNQTVALAVPADGLVIDADSDRMAQVISNLLTNASKYSEPGTSIDVQAERAGERVVLRVRDHGIGIAAGQVDLIFDLFFQPPQAIDRAKGGLGLGLAIVRSLVELHGGTVFARSEGLGKGSELVVELPLASAQAIPARRTVPPLLMHGDRELRVLVVDDNVDSAALMSEFLGARGYEVRIAYDGNTALDVAREFAPQACLLDIGLPGMNGYELARKLRIDNAPGQPLKLIAVTGYGQDADKNEARAAGFDAHIAKPVNLEGILAALR